jgi:hypothetical protein
VLISSALHVQAGNILIDHRGQVILADMGVATAMARSHRLHERTSLDGQPQVLTPVIVTVVLHHVAVRSCRCSLRMQHPTVV